MVYLNITMNAAKVEIAHRGPLARGLKTRNDFTPGTYIYIVALHWAFNYDRKGPPRLRAVVVLHYTY